MLVALVRGGGLGSGTALTNGAGEAEAVVAITGAALALTTTGAGALETAVGWVVDAFTLVAELAHQAKAAPAPSKRKPSTAAAITPDRDGPAGRETASTADTVLDGFEVTPEEALALAGMGAL